MIIYKFMKENLKNVYNIILIYKIIIKNNIIIFI